MLDTKESLCVSMIALHGGEMEANHPSLDRFIEDRYMAGKNQNDTLSRLYKRGILKQVQYDGGFVIRLAADPPESPNQ